MIHILKFPMGPAHHTSGVLVACGSSSLGNWRSINSTGSFPDTRESGMNHSPDTC